MTAVLLLVTPGSAQPSGAASVRIHFVAHSHDDVGWLKTYEQYQFGRNDTIQRANVNVIYDSVIASLAADARRKFTAVEVAFFLPWLTAAAPATQQLVRELVAAGQLQFAGGGWVMHDEATTSWYDMIDQMSLGHELLAQTLCTAAPPTSNKTNTGIAGTKPFATKGECLRAVMPRVGWQIDPFGHSATHQRLFAQGAGKHSTVHSRVDYAEFAFKQRSQGREALWTPAENALWAWPAGVDGQAATVALTRHPALFTSTMLHSTYCPPPDFNFDVLAAKSSASGRDLEALAAELISMVRSDVAVTSGGDVMVAMGCDFAYQQADTWFRSIDALIDRINAQGNFEALYSTPADYVQAKAAATVASANATSSARADEELQLVAAERQLRWPVMSGDSLPYSDGPSAVWSGFFSSRSAFKRHVREASALCRRLAVEAARAVSVTPTDGASTTAPRVARSALAECREAVATAQHHDAVTGTSRQHVSDDYVRRLHRAQDAAASALAAVARMPSYDRPTDDAGNNGTDAVVPSGWARCPLCNQSLSDTVAAWWANTTRPLEVLVAPHPIGVGGELTAWLVVALPVPAVLRDVPTLQVALAPPINAAGTAREASVVEWYLADAVPAATAVNCRGYGPAAAQSTGSSCFDATLSVAVSFSRNHAAAPFAPVVVQVTAGTATTTSSQAAGSSNAGGPSPAVDQQHLQRRRGSARRLLQSGGKAQRYQSVAVGNATLRVSADGLHTDCLQVGPAAPCLPLRVTWCYLVASTGDSARAQPSGAYVFRPNVSADLSGDPSTVACLPLPGADRKTALKVAVLTERTAVIEQRVADFITVRYALEPAVDPDAPLRLDYFMDDVPIADGIGKEILMVVNGNASVPSSAASFDPGRRFWSDRNGFGPLVAQPFGRPASAEYPSPSAAAEGDAGSAFSRTVVPVTSVALLRHDAGSAGPVNASIDAEIGIFPDRTVGAAMSTPSGVAFLVQRRLLFDDARGVGEPLNETESIEPYVDCDARAWAATLALAGGGGGLKAVPGRPCGARSGDGVRVYGTFRFGASASPSATPRPATVPAEPWWVRPARRMLNPVAALLRVGAASPAPHRQRSGPPSARPPAAGGLPAGIRVASVQPAPAAVVPARAVLFRLENALSCGPAAAPSQSSLKDAQQLRWDDSNAAPPSVHAVGRAQCLRDAVVIVDLRAAAAVALGFPQLAAVPCCEAAACETASAQHANASRTAAATGPDATLGTARCVCIGPLSLLGVERWRSAAATAQQVVADTATTQRRPSAFAFNASDTSDWMAASDMHACEVRSFVIFGL